MFRQASLDGAVCQCPLASEGDYVVLQNPAEDGKNPSEGTNAATPQLKYGMKVNIPGPCSFALWPGQVATVVAGHRLRSNEFLRVRIYNEEEAAKNWDQAVAVAAVESEPPKKEEGESKKGEKAQDGGNAEQEESAQDTEERETVVAKAADELDLTIGKIFVIQGTEVSYYIPPTGVEVLQGENGKYVQSAITLEQLEYCILLDENGNKRYEYGPSVVFPNPTEEFQKDGDGHRKFRAIELNAIQGIHVKVTAPYQDGEVQHEQGEELFITGKTTPIYYPRPEHSIIAYGGKKKHYAVAIPPGEGRYVMDRLRGDFELVKGPHMLLCDPVENVIVRRVLTDDQVNLWYPGNSEALAYNRDLRRTIAEHDEGADDASVSGNYVSERAYAKSKFATSSSASSRGAGDPFTDEITRGTTFTEPRQLTLDTKYDGVPVVGPWTNYAVKIVDKQGNRRVVVGPETVLLNYDETLEVLSLSTGKPKTADMLQRTVYLQVKNNKVSDIVKVSTRDHVEVEIKLSFRVNFEGDQERWFDVENYVKLLCDHARSMLKGAVRKCTIEEFYGNGVDIVRDIILGPSSKKDKNGPASRPGLPFDENGMRVIDVEVLDISINDPEIADMLSQAQLSAVSGNIELTRAQKRLEIDVAKQKLDRERQTEEAKTAELRHELALKSDERRHVEDMSAVGHSLEAEAEKRKLTEAREALTDFITAADLDRRKAQSELETEEEKAAWAIQRERLETEVAAVVKRFESAQEGFSEALLALGSQDTLVKVADAMSMQKVIGGDSAVDAIVKIFAGTPLQGLMTTLGERAGNKGNGRTKMPEGVETH